MVALLTLYDFSLPQHNMFSAMLSCARRSIWLECSSFQSSTQSTSGPQLKNFWFSFCQHTEHVMGYFVDVLLCCINYYIQMTVALVRRQNHSSRFRLQLHFSL